MNTPKELDFSGLSVTSKEQERRIIALGYGRDRPGLAALTAMWVYKRNGDIVHADQHTDEHAGVFFQRLEWCVAQDKDPYEEMVAYERMSKEQLGMKVRCYLAEERANVAIMVSHLDHCYHDLIQRFQSGELRGNLSCIVSNHSTLKGATEHYGVPFYEVPVTGQTKHEAEKQQMRILSKYGVRLVIMARYMQVLSEYFLEGVGCPVINIHHSFLPAFKGGKPYQQAYERGVKLIGATAHYATVDLDEGPIIWQEAARVTHRDTVEDLVRLGRDLERTTLAQAVRHHLESRVLVYNKKTIVF